MWMWSPDAPAMDLRFYHDGMGQDTHEKQYDGGLEITYEDYEPGFGSAHLTVFAAAALLLRALPGSQRGLLKTLGLK